MMKRKQNWKNIIIFTKEDLVRTLMKILFKNMKKKPKRRNVNPKRRKENIAKRQKDKVEIIYTSSKTIIHSDN